MTHLKRGCFSVDEENDAKRYWELVAFSAKAPASFHEYKTTNSTWVLFITLFTSLRITGKKKE